MTDSTIIYTHTDEAPALATYSFLPVVQAYAATAGVQVATRDISLAGRIIATFSDRLDESQRVEDALAELGALAESPEANIIKLPNVSASLPQLKAAIAELQQHGYPLPDYPDDPTTDEDRDVRSRYGKVMGSAVNPVLRQGNSDRRAPASVKNYARAHPHRMGPWSPESRTNVAHMGADDFRSTEQSAVIGDAGALRIELVANDGTVTVLRASVPVLAGEVVDASVMRVAALHEFLAAQIVRAKEEGVLFSVHLKATMMKVSDPIIFGHVVRAFFPATFARYGEALAAAGLSPNDGLGAIFAGLGALPEGATIRASFDTELAEGPALAMVDSDRGITNLHVPSDVRGRLHARHDPHLRPHVGPGRRGGRHPRRHPRQQLRRRLPGGDRRLPDERRLRPATMGSVPNVGLMAQAAEEYGSHDKTFEVSAGGTVRVVDEAGTVVLAQPVGHRRRVPDVPDQGRAHPRLGQAGRHPGPGDRRPGGLLARRGPGSRRQPDHQGPGLPPRARHRGAADRDHVPRNGRRPSPWSGSAGGENTISVTGNVLRDYLTDLFPIMELGTSAKMLSVVPLINGGGLFETGAGGSAPKHVQQLLKENYLRWDSLGEFLALAVSFEHLAQHTGNARAQILADTLDRATGTFLDQDRSPSRRLGGIDNRGSHFYLALYWAQELAAQTEDALLAEAFAGLAKTLAEQEQVIVDELIAVQGSPTDIGGYYQPDPSLAAAVMRPSAAFNDALAVLG